MVTSARIARQRYEAERDAARQEQGRNNRLVDWWETIATPAGGTKRFRHRPGSHVTSWLEDGEEVGCCILPGCLPEGWVAPPEEKQKYIKMYVPLFYFVGNSGKVLRFGEKEDDLDKEDGGVLLPSNGDKKADLDKEDDGVLLPSIGDFDHGVALPLRLNKGVDSGLVRAEERMVALPIRNKSAQGWPLRRLLKKFG